MNSCILFVDDEPNVLSSLRRMLRGQSHEWAMTFLERADRAWDHLLQSPVDAVVTDVRMPLMDGLELLRRIRENETTRDVPVIMLTGLADRGLKAQALDLGATDLLNKPVEPEELLARLRSALKLRAFEERLRQQNEMLEEAVKERTAQLEASQVDIIWRLGKAAEFRDEETGQHVVRVGYTSRVIAQAIGLDDDVTEQLFLASPLHDIGKIGIPDAVLLKRGRLTEVERRVMQEHCAIGAAILRDPSQSTKFMLGTSTPERDHRAPETVNPLLGMAATIALSHHERWDGRGYPHGTSGEQIPVEARIVAICDVYDALRSKRSYKPAYTEEHTMSLIRKARGTQFDPAVVTAFESSLDEVRAIQDAFREDGTSRGNGNVYVFEGIKELLDEADSGVAVSASP